MSRTVVEAFDSELVVSSDELLVQVQIRNEFDYAVIWLGRDDARYFGSRMMMLPTMEVGRPELVLHGRVPTTPGASAPHVKIRISNSVPHGTYVEEAKVLIEYRDNRCAQKVAFSEIQPGDMKRIGAGLMDAADASRLWGERNDG